MRFRVELSEEAKFDLASSASWYEIRSEGRGERFISAVEQMLDRIGDNPETYPLVRGDVRHAAMKPYPYVIYYEVRDDIVSVIGIIHASRNPSVWRRRWRG